MLYQTVRPKNLDEIVGNDIVISSFRRFTKCTPEERSHAFLLSGPSGCGKTTLARAVAAEIGCTDMGLIELNAANTRGIDTIREVDREAFIRPLTGTSKVYIFDESHQLTVQAQQALLKIIEDNPLHTYFFFCTTEPQNLIKTIQNRCDKYEMSPLKDEEIVVVLKFALEKIKQKKDEEILKAIAYACNGSPREALVLLERILFVENEEEILDLLTKTTENNPSIWDVVRILSMSPEKRRKKWKYIINKFKAVEGDSETIRRALLSHLMNRLIDAEDEEEAIDYTRLLKLFSQSTYYGGKNQLGSLIVQACFIEEL